MSIAKLIEEQAALFAGMDAKFAEKITPANFEQRIKGLTGEEEKRIEARIGALETRKTAAAARYDKAIATEKKALVALKALRLDPSQGVETPPKKPTGGGGAPKKPVVKPVKKTVVKRRGPTG